MKGNSTEHAYEVKLNSPIMDQYPNMVIIPVIHITPKQIDTIVSFVIIKLSTTIIFISKHEILGFLDQRDTEICKITTCLAFELLALEVRSEQPENPLLYRKGQFISSQLIFQCTER